MARYFSRWYWALLLSWRFLRGRWFIFRDAPDWVCAEYACELELDGRPPELKAMGQQAHDELLLRISSIRREIERERAEIAALSPTTPTSETP